MRDDYPSELGPDAPASGRSLKILASGYFLWIILIPVLMLGGIMLVLILARTTAPTTSKSSDAGRRSESGLETARQGLTRQTDLNACRSALQQINAELGEKPARRPPSLTKEQKTWLHDNLSLSDEELNEADSRHYTKLDNHHLFRCFLMRDVASALEVKGVRGQAGGRAVREKPLDQAARAFAWVMREVRLRPREGGAAPPSFVVRRGWGTALERALIFLALLEQLGDPDAVQPELLGFLLSIPSGSGATRLWACGVVVGDDKEVYLFDPHLGLPLPGPKGEGIATLTQAREQPEVLAQLNFSEKYPYRVTAEQAREAQAQLVCPLSALSPRMRYLQEKLLAPVVRVRLATDAATDLERVKTACSAGVKKSPSVLVARDRCTLLYRFLPEEEGGVDNTSRKGLFYRDLVPMQVLPRGFRDERLFPRESELGQRVLGQFAAFFLLPTMESGPPPAGQPRDHLLRGRYTSAVQTLVTERENWRAQLVQRANAVDLEDKVNKWLEQATSVYAHKIRAKQPQERQLAEQQVKELWDPRVSWPILIILNSSAAGARKPEVDYQLALCAQEQAEQLHARLDLQAQVGAKAHRIDVEKVKSDWENTLNAWKRFDEDYPKLPEGAVNREVRSAMRAAARFQRARAEAVLGNSKAAIASWKDVSGFPTDLEKLASLYLARQWEKKHLQ